jgi:hypothetical protein
MAKTIRAGEMNYGKAESLSLREGVIVCRDEALDQGAMTSAVFLSHVIAWMAVMIEEHWPESPNGHS